VGEGRHAVPEGYGDEMSDRESVWRRYEEKTKADLEAEMARSRAAAEAAEKARSEAEDREVQRRMVAYKRKYGCGICRQPTAGARKHIFSFTTDPGEEDPYIPAYDCYGWDEYPPDMTTCEHCNTWVHINGRCGRDRTCFSCAQRIANGEKSTAHYLPPGVVAQNRWGSWTSREW
jgi:hypothetical protein